jgi:glycosyltransferase involved in cell wall biosynthesis
VIRIAPAHQHTVKLVIFAHTPPPFHGQSYMVKLLLEGLHDRAGGAQPTLRVYHVNAKLSSNLEAIGKFRWSKMFLILKYCAQAYWHRFVHGADAFYYVPAPGLRAAVYRDWIVMFLCRPLFKQIIFHWHAVGLGEWIDTQASPWERKLAERLLGRADLSIVLSNFARADANRFSPLQIEVIPNGVPDPCRDFDAAVLPARQKRLHERSAVDRGKYSVLFLGACTAAKGLFATLDAIAILRARFAQGNEIKALELVVAGEFASEEERDRFQKRIAREDLNGDVHGGSVVNHRGFVSAEAKSELFRHADCLCFPTQYSAEGQPVTIIEALAFGLSVVATRWRGIPELLDKAAAQLVDDQDPEAIASALEIMLRASSPEINRGIFLSRYEVSKFVEKMRAVISGIE